MFDEVDDDDDDDDDELLEPDEPLLPESDLIETTQSKETDLETNKHQRRLKQLKKLLNKLTMHFVWKMHTLSRNYGFIIKVLAHERKCLDGPLNADLKESKSSM